MKADLESLRHFLSLSPFMVDLGVEATAVAEGRVSTVLTLAPRHLQHTGQAHAGVSSTLADHTMGSAAQTLAPEGWWVVTAELKVSLLRPAKGRRLVCDAVVIKPGRMLMFTEATEHSLPCARPSTSCCTTGSASSSRCCSGALRRPLRRDLRSVLDTCERIAREKFAPFNRLVDTQEPRFDGERVHLPQATHAASGGLRRSRHAGRGAGLRSAACSCPASSRWRPTPSSQGQRGIGGYGMLTSGNANLLMAHGTPLQREVFAKNEFAGRWFGTMCLSEPQAGSSLSDVATRALPDGGGLRSRPAGPALPAARQQDVDQRRRARSDREHRAPGAGQDPGPDGKPVPGTRGISLFIVPKKLVDAQGGSPASATTSRWPA
jgi:uncharacterized protein (TIGR00369 family)